MINSINSGNLTGTLQTQLTESKESQKIQENDNEVKSYDKKKTSTDLVDSVEISDESYQAFENMKSETTSQNDENISSYELYTKSEYELNQLKLKGSISQSDIDQELSRRGI